MISEQEDDTLKATIHHPKNKLGEEKAKPSKWIQNTMSYCFLALRIVIFHNILRNQIQHHKNFLLLTRYDILYIYIYSFVWGGGVLGMTWIFFYFLLLFPPIFQSRERRRLSTVKGLGDLLRSIIQLGVILTPTRH